MIFSEEQTMIRDMARQFARDRLASANGFEAEGSFPAAIVAEMGELGLLGMTVPPEWGGAGVDMISYVLALEEIAAGCGALSTMMSVNNSPVAAAVNAYGTPEQKQQFLVPLAQGKVIGAFCLTEPQAGSDASALRASARRDGDHFVLNGTKQFITSGRIAGFALVFAVTDQSAGKKGISCFIVPTDSPGYVVASTERKLGQRASDTCQIVFENCRVPAAYMLGGEGEGYRIALANLETGRIGIAAQSIGMARAAFEAARAYAGERQAFGTAIVNHQAVAFRLADMATQIAVARQMALHAAELKQSGRPCLTEAAMSKVFASEMAERVCSDAIQIHGGYGYVEGYPVERIYRDVRVCQIYEGTSDVQRLIISRALPTI